jgi:hypothetical protein
MTYRIRNRVELTIQSVYYEQFKQYLKGEIKPDHFEPLFLFGKDDVEVESVYEIGSNGFSVIFESKEVPIKCYESLVAQGWKIEAYFCKEEEGICGTYINGEFKEYFFSEAPEDLRYEFELDDSDDSEEEE